ncbi:serine/threonine protein phosphatase [Glutamicibacter uratoxydans]|uniref:Serine/threonine protein phosphatase n=1 Tax=Glutamicibacter uratoxydans TaxID=43667 RepID=A0A4Y4DMZ8_GLUUR|nr:protein phosphatase 2C domain-containing protein [Glutamicibacter uratoxydans]GED06699.1 serine/threonine protein phosphatase [Glutamicibacter uratoxydans]
MSVFPTGVIPTLKFGCATDKGLRRVLNEDSMLALDSLVAVADGMGGHEAGEVASSLCLKVVAEGYARTGGEFTAQSMDQLLTEADQAIIEAGSARAGTTLTGAAVVSSASTAQWLVFNIGDSRTYRLSGGVLEQISIDHSEVQELLDRGELTTAEAATYPKRNVVTRALGMRADSRPDFWMLPIDSTDRLLVCSDGLSSELGDEQIQEILRRFLDPQQAADELVLCALAHGGRDNVSVIVADVASTEIDEPLDVEITVPREQLEIKIEE